MKKVITFGVFDYFHYGHLRLFERARAYGDYLIIAVQEDDYILKTKPDANILYSTEQRCEIIKELRCVDRVVTYTDVDVTIKNCDFDVFILGGDQNHAGFQRAIKWCKENNKEIVRLSRTEGISSSQIKRGI